jgi:hypothetical protein
MLSERPQPACGFPDPSDLRRKAPANSNAVPPNIRVSVSAEKFTGRLSALDERNRERPPETDMPYVELFENRRIGLSLRQ